MEHTDHRVLACRRRLEEIEVERSALLAELATFENTFPHVEGSRTILGGDKATPKRPKVSRVWAAILQRLAGYKHFNASDVMIEANRLFQEEQLMRKQSYGGIRSQLSQLTRKGIISRLGGGNYRVSEHGKALLQSCAAEVCLR